MGQKRYPEEKIFEVLNWMNVNGKTQLECAEHFNLNRKTVSAWLHKYNYEEMKAEFQLSYEKNSSHVVIERRLPVGIKEEANANLLKLSLITTDCLVILQKWITRKLNLINHDGIDSLKAYEVDKILRIVNSAAQYTIPMGVDLDENSTSLLETVRDNLAKSRLELETKRNKAINS
jgi:hypothetical protein